MSTKPVTFAARDLDKMRKDAQKLFSKLIPIILAVVAYLIYRRTTPLPAKTEVSESIYNALVYTYAYQWGVVALGVIWLLIWFFTGHFNPFNVVIGADGRPSTSKLKPFLWFLVIFFSYAVLYSARVIKSGEAAVSDLADIPPNVLIALGFSLFTAVAAKNITESQVASGQVIKPAVTDSTSPTAGSDSTAGAGAIIQDDKGYPDLSKIQTMGWTLLAIVIYLVSVNETLSSFLLDKTRAVSLPNIDSSLMVLMGLGDAAYLGKKLVTTRVPIISNLLPIKGKKGETVTITGTAFGAKQQGSKITIDGVDFDGQIQEQDWNDTQVKFKMELPTKHPKVGKVTSDTIIQIGLVVNGQESNKLPFTYSE